MFCPLDSAWAAAGGVPLGLKIAVVAAAPLVVVVVENVVVVEVETVLVVMVVVVVIIVVVSAQFGTGQRSLLTFGSVV